MQKILEDFRKALNIHPKAKAQWENITPIARRDFVSWIESAKQPETRKRRIAVTCSKLMHGERRPCCYAVVPMNLYKTLNTNQKAKNGWKNLTANEKRNFIDWINSAKDTDTHERRIVKICSLLASRKKDIAK